MTALADASPRTRLHGTRAKYVVERCRCDLCRTAVRDYERWRTRQRAYGRTAYVDADPVRTHLRTLSAAGMGWKRAARHAGLAESTVWKLLYGDPQRGQAPSKRCRRRTAAALLAVTADLDRLADAALVPAIGAQRRLQALVAVGWSQTALADRMGMELSNFGRVIVGPAQLRAATVRRARTLYDELWDTPPPRDTPQRRAAVTRALSRARRLGWAPPLTWDDEEIDDPAAQPHTDRSADRRPPLDLAEVDHLAEAGAHITEIARRLGCSVYAIEQARRRARAVAS